MGIYRLAGKTTESCLGHQGLKLFHIPQKELHTLKNCVLTIGQVFGLLVNRLLYIYYYFMHYHKKIKKRPCFCNERPLFCNVKDNICTVKCHVNTQISKFFKCLIRFLLLLLFLSVRVVGSLE